MIVGSFTKQEFEIVPLSVDFVRELIRDDDTILTPSVTAVNIDTGEDSSIELLLGGPLLGDSIILQNGIPIRTETRVVQRLRGGTNGERHLITFRIITTRGQRWEGGLYLLVEDP
jgi:hypothetical protein